MASAAATSLASSFWALSANLPIISQNSLIFLTAADFKPNFSRSSEYAALKRDSSCSLAAAERAVSEVSPMPLAGLLTILLNDSSSLRLTASLK